MSYRQAASRAFTPSPQMASQVARTRDIDTLLGVMLSTNPAIPLRRKWDAAVRLETYLPAFIHASLTAIAFAVAGKEAIEAEVVGYRKEQGSGETLLGIELAKSTLMSIFRRVIDNIEFMRSTAKGLDLDPPPKPEELRHRGTVLSMVDAIADALSKYYISQVERREREDDIKSLTYLSGRLAAAIVDPIRAYMSALT